MDVGDTPGLRVRKVDGDAVGHADSEQDPREGTDVPVPPLSHEAAFGHGVIPADLGAVDLPGKNHPGKLGPEMPLEGPPAIEGGGFQ